MNKREENIRLLKLAAAGKLSAEDLTEGGDPTFDITLHLNGPKPPVSEAEALRLKRLKQKGLYYDITLNLNA